MSEDKQVTEKKFTIREAVGVGAAASLFAAGVWLGTNRWSLEHIKNIGALETILLGAPTIAIISAGVSSAAYHLGQEREVAQRMGTRTPDPASYIARGAGAGAGIAALAFGLGYAVGYCGISRFTSM